MAGIGIKVVETKARVVPKAAVLWLYDDPERESDVSSLSLKCLFEEEVLKHVKEFDPKNPPVSVSPSNIVLNDKTYIGKWTEKGSTSFHRCKVLKISGKLNIVSVTSFREDSFIDFVQRNVSGTFRGDRGFVA